MIVYIVRHAWAEERDDSKYPDDRSRPLTDEGRERFARVAANLVQRDFKPQIIATSPLVRCRQTAEIVAAAMSTAPAIVELNALEPGSNLNELGTWTEEQGDKDVAWVGHAPDVSDLAAALIGQGDCALRFAKGAAAAIRFDNGFQRGRGELQWLVSAKILGC